MTDSFRDYVLDQLRDLRGLRCMAMFGGHGIYRGDDFFAILHKGRLYFKTDAVTLALFAERGMKPFRPKPGLVLKSYYEVPPDVIEDPEVLSDWARRALAQRPESSTRQLRRPRRANPKAKRTK